jgi:hypothetical protein
MVRRGRLNAQDLGGIFQAEHGKLRVVGFRLSSEGDQNSSFNCTAIMRGLLSPPRPTPSKPVGGDVV